MPAFIVQWEKLSLQLTVHVASDVLVAAELFLFKMPVVCNAPFLPSGHAHSLPQNYRSFTYCEGEQAAFPCVSLLACQWFATLVAFAFQCCTNISHYDAAAAGLVPWLP